LVAKKMRQTRAMTPRTTPIPIPASAPEERPVLCVELDGAAAEEEAEAAAAAAFRDVEVEEVGKEGEVLGDAMREESDVGAETGAGELVEGIGEGVMADELREIGEGVAGVEGESGEVIAEVLVLVGGACWSDTMVARALGAGAAQVSLVVMEHWTPVVGSLPQQAQSPVVALYVISG
jgi:hypothetical protein